MDSAFVAGSHCEGVLAVSCQDNGVVENFLYIIVMQLQLKNSRLEAAALVVSKTARRDLVGSKEPWSFAIA